MICTMYAPWFGALPFYTVHFLASCALSPHILWVIHSDQKPPKLPKLTGNVVWQQIFNLNERIASVFPEHAKPRDNWGHKLCDLKPFWHLIFPGVSKPTEYQGWCDWDVVHDLSALVLNFNAGVFTPTSQNSPLFICRTSLWFDWWPSNPALLFRTVQCLGWDEFEYLPKLPLTVLQQGLTPEVDLFEPAQFAVHMYRAKHSPVLYEQWIKQYLKKRN